LLKALTGFESKTNIHEGISQFVKWYRSYYWNKSTQSNKIFQFTLNKKF
jgi:hypothetical protein